MTNENQPNPWEKYWYHPKVEGSGRGDGTSSSSVFDSEAFVRDYGEEAAGAMSTFMQRPRTESGTLERENARMMLRGATGVEPSVIAVAGGFDTDKSIENFDKLLKEARKGKD